MSLPILAIRNHQLTLLLSAILVLLGVVSYFSMPRAEDPLLDFPLTAITVINPGTSPEDMESLIVDPIEDVLNELDDIKKITSNMEDGMARLNIEFLYGSDSDEKFDYVQSAVNSIKSSLPSSIVKLEIKKINPNNIPILQFSLSSENNDFVSLRQFSENLEKKLEKIPGVKQVDIEAQAKMEVQILLHPAKLHALGISLDQIKQSISTAAENIPGGHVEAGERQFSILTSGDFNNLDEIRNTIISSKNDQLIYLRNIATISINEGLPSYRTYYQGKSCVFINILQRPGTNIFTVTNAVYKLIDKYKQSLPKQLSIDLINDQSIGVEKRVSGFFSSLIQGLLLVAVATFLVLGRGPSFVVVITIPISIFIAIGWLDFAGFAIQQMSIVGLVIALGLLVDNAIVVTENAIRLQREGLTSQKAAEQGSNQVTPAIISGTLTTILSFVPILLMRNDAGSFIRSMPVTVILALLASLLIALTLTPLLTSKIKRSGIKATFIQNKLTYLAQNQFKNSLTWVLDKPRFMLLFALIIFCSSLALFPLIGVSLFPKAEKPIIFVNIDLPEGTNFQQTKKQALAIEGFIRKQSLVEDIAVNVGRGNPRIYYNISPDRQTPNFAQLLVKLKQSDLTVVEPFVEKMRKHFAQYPGVSISIKELHQGPSVDAPITIRIIGEDWQNIREASFLVENIINLHKGVVNVKNPIRKNKIDIKIDINRDKAAMLGIPLNQIDQNIRAALVGLPMGIYKDEQGADYSIVLKSADSSVPILQNIETLMLRTPNGTMVPLKQIAKARLTTSIPRLVHHNFERAAIVSADIRPGFNTSEVTKQILSGLSNIRLTENVKLSVGGEQSNREESFGGMLKALIIAMLGIFAVLVMQFRSFKQPFIVFSAIPFAGTGAFFCLYITGYTFSFTAFVGLTSLVGIVVNNAIMLIEYANQQQAQGATMYDAIVQSAQTRMTPIILTTVTTIGGLLPLTLTGAAMWAPMGWTIIGGLLTSTLLTLFMVPVLYLKFTEQQNVVCNAN